MSNITLLNVDCMSYMAGLPDKAFDLAIVDPPYGIGKFTSDSHTSWETGKRVKNGNKFDRDYDWNEFIPEDFYFKELARISYKRIIWGANYYNCFEGGNGAVIWHKGNQAQTISHCEIASLSFQKRVDFIKVEWQSGFYRKLVEGDVIHPCQKPVKLYKWLLHKYAKSGDRILDTHLGSGSSAIAAHQMGFDFVGTEIDLDYYNAAVKRFKEVTMQSSLFGSDTHPANSYPPEYDKGGTKTKDYPNGSLF